MNPINNVAPGPIKSTNRATHTLKVIKRDAILAGTVIHSAISEQLHRFQALIVSLLRKISGRQSFNPFEHIKHPNRPLQDQHEWRLNAAILGDIVDKTEDPTLKKQIQFMIRHYLSKVTPVQAKTFRLINHQFQGLFQIGPKAKHFYHRMAFRQDSKLLDDIAKKLPLKKSSPCVLLDTPHFEHLLPLKFHVIPLDKIPTEQELAQQIRGILAQGKDLADKPLILDLSKFLSESIVSEDKKAFKRELRRFRSILKKSIKMALKENNPRLRLISYKREKKRLYKNIIGISKFNLDDSSGVKLLPLAPHFQRKHMIKFSEKFLNFIDETGLFIGHVNAGKQLNLHENPDLHIDRADKKFGVFFPQPNDFLHSNFFTRKVEKLAAADTPVRILGMATTHLLQGFLQELEGDAWNQICAHPIKNELMQTLLYKMAVRLSDAPTDPKRFAQFAQDMEIIHADLTSLLELTKPFTEADYAVIAKTPFDHIPEALAPLMEARLGKTAVNTFAGLNAAVIEMNNNPVKIAGGGLYYEETGFLGGKYLEEVLADASIKKVDFYACQFNPNIDIDDQCHHYASDPVEKNIRSIFEKKPDTDQLTVAVDITIDYANSERMQTLLKSFEKEILEGKLNLVFFRSGQKFDIMGMDNYYGSPFFVVNNRDAKWTPFQKVLDNPGHRTDPLSLQWFTLMNKYAVKELDDYRRQIFINTRDLLKQIPQKMLWNARKPNQTHISTADEGMDACFIDIKLKGRFHRFRSIALIAQFFKRCLDAGIKAHTRASFGFYHPNCILISVNAEKGSSSLRINPGLNPKDNEAILKFIQDLT